MNYLKGTFTIDFISAFPVDVIALMLKDLSSRQLKLFSLLKLVRMLRLSRIIRALKVPRGLKAQLKLAVLTLKLLLYVHCSACIQLYIIQYESLWEHPVYMLAPMWEGKFSDTSAMHQYIVCLNYSLILNKGKNILPLTKLQHIVDMISMLLGLAFLGYLLGQFKLIKFEMAEMSFIYQKISSSLTLTLQMMDLPDDIANETTQYAKLIGMIDYNKAQLGTFFMMTSPSLLNRIQQDMIEKIKWGVFSCKGLSAPQIQKEIVSFSKVLELQDWSKDSVLFESGDECNGIYIVSQGAIKVFVRSENHKFSK